MDSNGNYKAEFLYGPAGLISHSRASRGTVFYAFDALGSVSSVVRDTGALVSTRTYDSYGSQAGGIVASATYDDPEIGYNGQSGYITDAETGLVICGHRYYDPANGRWLNRDPIGYSGGINVYRYCGNNPVMGVDISGFQEGPEPDPVSPEPGQDPTGDPTDCDPQDPSVGIREGLRWLWRLMARDSPGSSQPALRNSSSGLGLRPDDIEPDSNGMVRPGTGGLSVTPSGGKFPFTSKNPAFGLPEEDLPPELIYRPDPARPNDHGFIEPAFPMPYQQYTTLLILCKCAKLGYVCFEGLA